MWHRVQWKIESPVTSGKQRNCGALWRILIPSCSQHLRAKLQNQNHVLTTVLLLACCVCLAVSDSCDHRDCSPPGSSVHGILPVRILEWLPFLSPGDLPDPGIEPGSSALQADSLPNELSGKPLKPYINTRTSPVNQKCL